MEPVKLLGMDEPREPHINLNKLARLSHREVYEQVLQTHQPESHDEFPNIYPPDFQVLCFDFLYWASVLQPYEWETEYVLSITPLAITDTRSSMQLQPRMENRQTLQVVAEIAQHRE